MRKADEIAKEVGVSKQIAELGIFAIEAITMQQNVLEGKKLQEATSDVILRIAFDSLLYLKREQLPMFR